MSRIKKRIPDLPDTKIRKSEPRDEKIRFSFEFFDSSDSEMCPGSFPEGYVHKLMERLRHLSLWKLSEFQSTSSRSIRTHTHEWSNTARPDGYAHLTEQHRDYPGWQFCLSANEYGRVHGFMIDNIYYVIWLDVNHRLYPQR